MDIKHPTYNTSVECVSEWKYVHVLYINNNGDVNENWNPFNVHK